MSTTKTGNDFRDKVARILRMRYNDVATEHRIKTTTADIVFCDDTNPTFPQKIAVETKFWNKPLNSDDIREIYQKYQIAISQREISGLWIIGNLPLSATPQLSLRDLAFVTYSTFDQFLCSMMNFSLILHDNESQFENDESSAFYIQSAVVGRTESLLQVTEQWINNHISNSMIIHGGYGAGKTTFSLKLAEIYSRQFAGNNQSRIPIRILLGDISSAQTLKALICSALNGNESGAYVRGFSYNLFLELNRLGLFILILDGFDEMRHAMHFDDFIFVLEQMSVLFEGKAKVVLLGRPSAFFDDREESRMLDAIFDRIASNRNSLEVVELAPATKSQVKSYLDYYMSKMLRGLNNSEKEKLHKIVSDAIDKEYDVLSRPLQLSMFAKILRRVLNRGFVLTRFSLYNEFLLRFSLRERTKVARRLVTGKQATSKRHDARIEFMQNIAWWVLTVRRENRFSARDIPTGLIPREFFGEEVDDETALREAVIGSIIQPESGRAFGKKGNKIFYFPHKSYMEFLVATFLIRERFTEQMYKLFFRHATSEIFSFLEEGPPEGRRKLEEGLKYAAGEIPQAYVDMISENRVWGGGIELDAFDEVEANDVYKEYIYLRNEDKDNESAAFLAGGLGRVKKAVALPALLNCAANWISDKRDGTLAKSIIAKALREVGYEELERFAEHGTVIYRFDVDARTIWAVLLTTCLRFHSNQRTVGLSLVDVENLSRRASSGGHGLFVQLKWAGGVKNLDFGIEEFAEVLGERGRAVLEKLSRCDDRLSVAVRLYGTAESTFDGNFGRRRLR